MEGMLIDTTKCTGCRACQVACKEWNNLPAEKTHFFTGEGYQNPPALSSSTFTLITFNEVVKNGKDAMVFSKRQCFHCVEPACVSVCPVTALKKTTAGPVEYNPDRCIGCRYCQVACPFDIPAFDWTKSSPEIKKCDLCSDRINEGLKPACAKTCPTGATLSGNRNDLIREAERRISDNPGRYVNHIYGKSEVGGTSVMYLSGVSFGLHGFRTDLPHSSIAEKSRPALESIPYVMTGMGVILGGVSWIINRRIENDNSVEKGGKES